MNISQLLESSRTHEDKSKVLESLKDKWAATGLLEGPIMEGVHGDINKGNMALMLESQNKQILLETQNTTQGGANFVTGNGEQWAGIALPMVRKVFGDISAKEFFSTQPISMPTGLIFFLDFKYANQQPFIGAGANSRFNVGDSIYGNTWNDTTVAGADPVGGLYGSGRFGYSINEYSATVPTASITLATASYADVNYDSKVSASVIGNGWRKLSIASASTVLPGVDTTAVRSFVATGSGVSEATVYHEYSSYNSTFDRLDLIVSGSITLAPVTVYYSKQTSWGSRGDFESTDSAPLTGSNEIPSINVAPRSEYISAKTRKLKYSYTQEALQDYQSFQNLNLDVEATAALSEHISKEIDLELLELANQAAAQSVEVWSAKNNTFFDKTTNQWSVLAAGSGGYYNSQGQWFETLGKKMNDVSKSIYTKTQRGEANVVMVSPKVSSIIEVIPGFAGATDGTKSEYVTGVREAGKLKGKFKVIVNPYMQENSVLMAYRGSSYIESGGVFSPYVPLVSTPLVFDPKDFTMSKGLSTRYGKKIINSVFFGKVLIANLDQA